MLSCAVHFGTKALWKTRPLASRSGSDILLLSLTRVQKRSASRAAQSGESITLRRGLDLR